MLTIRDSQVEAFRAASRRNLVRRIYDCLSEYWAGEFAEIGDGAVDEFIGNAIGRAGRHGFVRDVDVGRFVNLTLLLGEEFDEDPDLPWAAEILASSTLHPQHKLDQLLERGLAETRSPARLTASAGRG
jgi:hypothetical protein